MKPRRICLIHTAPMMVQLFTPLCRDRLPRGALTAPVLSSPALALDYVGERLARLRPN